MGRPLTRLRYWTSALTLRVAAPTTCAEYRAVYVQSLPRDAQQRQGIPGRVSGDPTGSIGSDREQTPTEAGEGVRAVSIDLSGAQWHKSSHSGGNDNCVEVAHLDQGVVAVRDTKNRRGAVLTFTPGAWDAFITGVGGDEFNRP